MNKGYYAIIPASVRYDKRLTPNAKLLYGEITALCNEKGYCWAGNEYFSDLYSVSTVSISKWVGSLKKNGYIEIEMHYKEGTKQILNRYIRLLGGGIKEKLSTSQRKVNGGIKEKFKDNSTSLIIHNNTTSKKGSRFTQPSVSDVMDYCNQRQNGIDVQTFVDFYQAKGWMVGKNKMKDWQACVRTWEQRHVKKTNGSIRSKSIEDKLTDRSWAKGRIRDTSIVEDLTDTTWADQSEMPLDRGKTENDR